MSGIAMIERSGYPGYDMDSLMFDVDDPDFGTSRSKMQISNKNLLGIHIRHSKSDSLLLSAKQSFYHHSSEDLDNQQPPHHRYSVFTVGWNNQLDNAQEDQSTTIDTTMLTIEGLKNHYNSCFTCGVSWYEDHVTLDCSECGGYSMRRPCPQCEGQCEGVWSRDLPASHKAHKAQWVGECKKCDQQILHGLLQKATLVPDSCDTILSKALDQLKTPL